MLYEAAQSTYRGLNAVVLDIPVPSDEALAEIRARRAATPPITYSGRPLESLPETIEYIHTRDMRKASEQELPIPHFMEEQDSLSVRLRAQVERNKVLLAVARAISKETREVNQQKPRDNVRRGACATVRLRDHTGM